MGKYFGTDGIRGTFGDDIINTSFAYRFGAALGNYLAAKFPSIPVNVVIGRDTRMSGQLLADSIIPVSYTHLTLPTIA